MAERPVLEAVVFDAGGTLVRLDFEWMSAAVTALGHPLDPATLRRAEVEGRRRFDQAKRTPLASWSSGEGAVPEDTYAYFVGMLEAAGVPRALAEGALPGFLERQRDHGLWMCPAEGARETLDTLAASGMRMACISNSDGRAEHHLRTCGVLDGLEFVVDSHLEGVEKPDPRIFRVALDRLRVAPERALYVGDILSVDQAGSRAAGMHFVLIDPWGDYAPEVPSIPRIQDLPRWIAARFEPVGSAPASGRIDTHAIGRSREAAEEDA